MKYIVKPIYLVKITEFEAVAIGFFLPYTHKRAHEGYGSSKQCSCMSLGSSKARGL